MTNELGKLTRIIRVIGLGLSIGIGSCTYTEADLTRTESVRFSINADFVDNARQECEGGESAALIVSLENSAGEELLSMARVELYKLGNEYMSATLQVPVTHELGETISLIDFLVIDSNGEVIYATPKSGSDLAHLVDHPLPMEIDVHRGSITTVVPQVVATCDIDASAMGYITFGIEIVDVSSRSINVEVNIAPNPSVVTNGLDSVKLVLFTPLYGWVEKKLDVIDSFRAVGNITYGQLGINDPDTTISILHTWVYAYYESIDEVSEITHTYIEQGTIGTPMKINSAVDSILVTDNMLQVKSTVDTSQSFSIDWNSWSYLSDLGGYITWMVNNDLCNPWFQYVIHKGSVNYLYADKNMYNAGYDVLTYRFKEWFNQGAGWYQDELVFENMCEEAPSSPIYGDALIYIQHEDESILSIYIEWVNSQTPIDPIKARTSGNSPRPVLQIKKVDRTTINNRISDNKQ